MPFACTSTKNKKVKILKRKGKFSQDNIPHRKTGNKLKLILAKRAEVRDSSPVVNACKTKPGSTGILVNISQNIFRSRDNKVEKKATHNRMN